MNEERYRYKKGPEFSYYEFISERPKGKIKKTILYTLIQDSRFRIYNLGFGDWDESLNDINDKVKTNNLDRQKVLATVADTVLDFTDTHPDAFIFIQGSTASRTRLYQIGISSFWNEINPLFNLLGSMDDNWEPFKKDRNYAAFLVKRK